MAALVLLVLLVLAATHAAPTQDTLVVRADLASASAPSPATESSQHVTSAPPPPLKTLSVEVSAEVALRYAHTAVLTRVRNPAPIPQETTFSLILPDTAFISGFVMTLGGKDYKAYVKEKAEAKLEYESAVAQGQAAAHVSAKARDSNHFSVRVHVEPNSEATFNLTYEELLERRNSLYHLALNLQPGGAVPRLRVAVHVREGRRITRLRVPALRTGNEIDAVEDDPQNPSALVTRSADEREASIVFEPDLAEQEQLMRIYAEKSRESRSKASHSYWPLDESADAPAQSDAAGVLGQFVVQYDVEHAADGEIFINDGYFVHFLSPPQLEPLRKHVVFVLDTSGSMMDRKILQLREAMSSILRELRPGDFFNIVEFASGTHVHRLEDARAERPTHKLHSFYASYEERQNEGAVPLVPPAPATADNLELARLLVSRLKAAGGTNINEALVTALRLVARGVHWTESTTTATTPFAVTPSTSSATSTVSSSPASDGLIVASDAGNVTAEPTPTASVPETANADAQPEPIVIFLTDGDPTVGELDPKRIIRRISELNSGPRRAALFSLAFGEDADRGFLRKLSLRNEGFMRHIYEAADAAAQLRSFYNQVSSPLLSDVKFVYPPGQVEEGSLTRHRFHALYAGGETAVAGRVLHGADLSPSVRAFCGGHDHGGKKEYRVTTPALATRGETEWGALERLWAYITIKQKLDERDSATADEHAAHNSTDAPEQHALRLALKYSFVTPLTSLVVVKPNASLAVDAESVDKQQPFLPAALFAANQLSGRPSPAGFASASFAAPASDSGGSITNPLILYDAVAQTAVEDDYEELSTPTLSMVGAGETQPDGAESTALLARYGLQHFPWAAPLLQASAPGVTLQLPALPGSASRTFKLLPLADVDSTEAVEPGAACGAAVGGGPGACTYLPRCGAARAAALTLAQYGALACDLRGYAGVCCPLHEAATVAPSSATVATPSTIRT